MKARTQRLPVIGLRSVQNARSRIYIPGSDPMFTRTSRNGATIRLVPAFPDSAPSAEANAPLFSQHVLDRLQSPVTRHRE